MGGVEQYPKELRTAEHERICYRRNEAVRLGAMGELRSESLKGLALSGGGIRAGFIARGLMEKLAERKMLAHFDYMSSVSGGGYAACMLTDHVGNLKKTPTFTPQNYKLLAPSYQWAMIVAGGLLDPLLNFLLLFAYICIPAWAIFANEGKEGKSHASLLFILGCLGGGLAYYSARMKWWTAASTQARESAVIRRAVILMFFCFFSTFSAAIWISFWWLIAIIVASMLGSGAFVAARPHRFRDSANPAFRWLLLALLSVLAVGTVRWFAQSSWFLPVDFGLALAGLLIAMYLKISCQNGMNLIFRAYRACLTIRFLPFATWLTKKRPFHATGQSWNPYPIINATANVGSHLETFELTPLYSGHEFSGYHRTQAWLPQLTLADAMAISGGAIDFIKKTATVRSLLGALIGGTDYWIPKQGRADQSAMLSLERLLTIAGRNPAQAIRLSDGGFVENLGVLALAKRRVQRIVCLDAGYDPDFKFEDLRKLCIMLQTQGLGWLEIQGIELGAQARRFRQNTSNILYGKLHYPQGPDFAAETADYVHIKISGARHPMQGKYADFPHLTTLDQRLTAEEIVELYKLGHELADELCDSPARDVLLR
ncbi:hypothetical protein GTP58_09945 [Duganella sp. CY15W]|uniref:hypothetical protein n=1 Tax=Duganella sp. CY15W TaxID=2692172 RepID=UPI001370F337|nr:hypothetical protein [Duganella sp. CY15W]MYM28643.1 hypothetical protein [Duganella sp. CY15W]